DHKCRDRRPKLQDPDAQGQCSRLPKLRELPHAHPVLLRQARPLPTIIPEEGRTEPQRVCRIEVEPGEEAQADFGSGAWVVDPANGSRRRPWVLRIVLSYSRKAY